MTVRIYFSLSHILWIKTEVIFSVLILDRVDEEITFK